MDTDGWTAEICRVGSITYWLQLQVITDGSLLDWINPVCFNFTLAYEYQKYSENGT